MLHFLVTACHLVAVFSLAWGESQLKKIELVLWKILKPLNFVFDFEPSLFMENMHKRKAKPRNVEHELNLDK